MYYQIDVSGPVPIYEQVIQQIKGAIATGSLRPDEPIPSVREIARKLAINPNTVARAYRDLQKEGVVYLNRGMGLNVDHGAPQRCRTERLHYFEANVERLFAEALRNRLDAETIRQVVTERLDRLTSEIPVV